MAAMAIGFLFVGFAYGPIGTVLAELFPATVRYTGSSLTYNFAGIVGASLAPYAAQWLAGRFGLQAVGWYLAGAAMLSLAGLAMSRETRRRRDRLLVDGNPLGRQRLLDHLAVDDAHVEHVGVGPRGDDALHRVVLEVDAGVVVAGIAGLHLLRSR